MEDGVTDEGKRKLEGSYGEGKVEDPVAAASLDIWRRETFRPDGLLFPEVGILSGEIAAVDPTKQGRFGARGEVMSRKRVGIWR